MSSTSGSRFGGRLFGRIAAVFVAITMAMWGWHATPAYAVVAATIDDVTVTESGANAVFTVNLGATSAANVTVNYTTADVTAVAGSDYTLASGTLTIPAGALTGTISVPVADDTVNEASETFNVNLSTISEGSITDAQGVGTITDNDAAPTLAVNDVTTLEGDSGSTNATFTVTLTGATEQTVTVAYATGDGTATAPADYNSVSNTLTFAPGTTTQSFAVPVIGDTLDEANETFTVNLSAATIATIADAQGVGTITDNDGSPALSIGDTTVTEGDTGSVNAAFTVTLAPVSGQTVTVDYTTTNGAAIAPGDYATTSGTLTFAAGVTTQTVNVAIAGDVVDETNETFTVDLTNAVNATISDTQGLGTITDDDAAPNMTIADLSIIEGTGGTTNAVFTVTLSAASGKTVTAAYTTNPSSATSPADFTATSSTLTFAPGITTQTITVPIVTDSVDEPNETFTIDLSAPVNINITDAQAIGTIVDDDGDPVLSATGVTVTEGNTGSVTATFTLTLSAPTAGTVTVDVATGGGNATAGSDYTAVAATTVTFLAGETRKTVVVTVAGDTVDEVDETFNLNFTNAVSASLAAPSVAATVVDDDGPVVSIANAADVTEGDSGATNAAFTVTLSAASPQDVVVTATPTVGTATAKDFIGTPQTVTIVAGATTATVNVPVSGDTIDEANETFTVILSSPANATLGTATGAANIIDNDDNLTADAAPDAVQKQVASGGTITTGELPSSADPLAAQLVTPVAGTVTLAESHSTTFADTSGEVTMVPIELAVEAPSASVLTPLQLTISIDGSALVVPGRTLAQVVGDLVVYRNGAAVGTCTEGTAVPDPCIASRTIVGDDVELVVRTSSASVWNVAIGSNSSYWLADQTGKVYGFGGAEVLGDQSVTPLNKPIVDLASTPAGDGYWLVASDGGVFTHGTATFQGSTGSMVLNKPVVGMSAMSNTGYWLVASDGGVFTFGDAVFHGSTGSMVLNQPIVGMAKTTSGNGYWLVASDGGVFTFGDAGFYGSTGSMVLNSPIVDMIPTKTGNGYWLIAADGGVFTFGDATFYGSTGSLNLVSPIVSAARTSSGGGYWLYAADGGVFTFGDAVFSGSAAGDEGRNVTGGGRS